MRCVPVNVLRVADVRFYAGRHEVFGKLVFDNVACSLVVFLSRVTDSGRKKPSMQSQSAGGR